MKVHILLPSILSSYHKKLHLRTHITLATASLCALVSSASLSHAVGVSEVEGDLIQSTLGTESAYELSQTGSTTNSIWNIDKYQQQGDNLKSIEYAVMLDEHVGDAEGDVTNYYKWTNDPLYGLILVEADSAADADIAVKVDSTKDMYIGPGLTEGQSFNQSFNAAPAATATEDQYYINRPSVDLGDITGDFIGTGYGHQGAINLGSTSIGNITGDFLGFSSIAIKMAGQSTSNLSSIESITGDFIGNNSYGQARGGVIDLDIYAHVGAITGDFIRNIAHGDLVIVEHHSNVDSFTGDFISNKSLKASTDTTPSVACISVVQDSTVGSITGDFINNYGTALNVHNSTVGNVRGSFIGNTQGGAISIYGHDNLSCATDRPLVGILAQGNDVVFTGNTNTKGESSAISIETEGEVFFNAYGKNTITVNDKITGDSALREKMILHINNGAGADSVSHASEDYSTVEFNNTVTGVTINAENGTLELGEYAGDRFVVDGEERTVAASQALLVGTDLNVSANATVNAYSADALGASASSNNITNSGTISYSKGSLANDMTLKNGGVLMLGGTGGSASTITVSGGGNEILGTGRSNKVSGAIANTGGGQLAIDQVSFSADTTVTNANAADITLSDSAIVDITMGTRNSFENVSSSSLAGYTGEADSLDLHVYDMLNVGGELSSVTLDGSITFDINLSAADMAHLSEAIINGDSAQAFIFQYGELGTEFDTIVYDSLFAKDGLSIYLNINGSVLEADLSYTDSGNNLAFAVITEGNTGDGVIPEPSTATLSLLALAGLLARRRRRAKSAVA